MEKIAAIGGSHPVNVAAMAESDAMSPAVLVCCSIFIGFLK
jgi:hypothetical protein